MTSHTVYEGAMWLPWIQKDVLHKPANAGYSQTKCGIWVGRDERVRSTDLLTEDGRGFMACPACFTECGPKIDEKPAPRIIDNAALAIAKLYYRECAICGSTQNVHVHHIVFRSQGGDDVDANFCGLCLLHHDEIHANKALAWLGLKVYVHAERPDTMEYLRHKLGERAGSFFDRG